MRFKEIPEDFYVEEILKEGILESKGKYSIYKIFKKNITTYEAREKISVYFKIKPEFINFCGLKDKRSVSIQYFSLPSYLNKNFDIGNLKGFFIGYSKEPLSFSSLKYNFFRVFLRDVKFKDEILERIEEIKIYGIPNYFDHQRFGHAIRYGKFIFEEIIKGEYEEALKVYFLSLEETGRKSIKKFKKMVKRYFGDWVKILKFAEGEEEREILIYLSKYKDSESAIFRIPEHKLIFYAEGYQSFLWNRAIYYFLKSLGLKGYRARHKLNPFFFYRTLSFEIKERLLKKNFPFPFTQNKEGDIEFIEILNKIEKEKCLNIKNEFKKYLIKSKRSAIFLPLEMKASFQGDDLEMSFYILPGSYASVLLKSLVSFEKIIKD